MLYALPLAVVAGCSSVAVSGVPGFGATLTAIWTGELATDLIVLGDDYTATTSSVGYLRPDSILLSTRVDGCDAYRTWVQAWADASADLVNRADGSPDAMCDDGARFARQMARAFNEYHSVAWHELRVDACYPYGACEFTEGAFPLGRHGDPLIYPTLDYWDVLSLDPDLAANAWDPLVCRLLDERFLQLTHPQADPGDESWLVVDGTLAITAIPGDGTIEGALAGRLYAGDDGWSANTSAAIAGSVDASFSAEACDIPTPSLLVTLATG